MLVKLKVKTSEVPMENLKNKLRELIPQEKQTLKELLEKFGDKTASTVTLEQVLGGLRGVVANLCDTSSVDPQKGLIIRGNPISEISHKLPEEIFFLLCTGVLPDSTVLKELQSEYKSRSAVPKYVWDVLRAMPKNSHPMAMLSTAILVMQTESVFSHRYNDGLKKQDHWEATLEDSLNLLAKLPAIAAGIYRIRFNKGSIIESNPKLDWAADFVHMTGIEDPKGYFSKFMQLYFTVHCDHEGCNVSAYTANVVSSALSDVYYSCSAGLNGLAGPLHGLANQESLRFILDIIEHFKGAPTDEDLKKYIWDHLKAGKVVPGYGHAVLRVTDPRFTSFFEFGKKHCSHDPVFKTVEKLFNFVPTILKDHGKATSPWPNIDASSGALLYHFGLKEFDYYTVLFGISRVMGFTSQMIWNRAIGMSITRPKSVTTKWIEEFVKK